MFISATITRGAKYNFREACFSRVTENSYTVQFMISTHISLRLTGDTILKFWAVPDVNQVESSLKPKQKIEIARLRLKYLLYKEKWTEVVEIIALWS